MSRQHSGHMSKVRPRAQTSPTTAQCSSTQSANPQMSFVLNSPGYGFQGAVRVFLANGLLVNPDISGPAAIRPVEQSGAGWVGLETTVTLNHS